jgi:hypothetical protein
MGSGPESFGDISPGLRPPGRAIVAAFANAAVGGRRARVNGYAGLRQRLLRLASDDNSRLHRPPGT